MRQILTFFASGLPERAGLNRSVASLLAAAFLIGSGASSAFSGEIKQAAAAPKPVVNCTCRYRGTNYNLGDAVCLNGPSGPRMATCDMVLNNTSWSFSKTPCPTARMTPVPLSILRISSNG
ncbi:hypothetical protein [Roseibium aggregatum]|uniref:Uncharacterized protein n=1 Tax=Roseibium aggregatum TaxID=187304 RepID=A0A926NY77_9HYPH|nr:hypothetical protein [Roseibium aggregatum]MBD1546285.1 hypothetical protein [Roseibium aggregatum]